MIDFSRQKRFELGRVLVSLEAVEQLLPADICEAVDRHRSGDWGDVTFEVAYSNDGGGEGEIKSRYLYRKGIELFVTTSGDRSETLVHLKEE